MITESQLQKAVLDYLEWYSKYHHIYFFRSAAGQVALQSGRHFRTGKPGCPDISVCCEGIYWGVEIKIEKGRQSALQKKAQEEIEAAGGRYVIIRSLADVKRLFPI